MKTSIQSSTLDPDVLDYWRVRRAFMDVKFFLCLQVTGMQCSSASSCPLVLELIFKSLRSHRYDY